MELEIKKRLQDVLDSVAAISIHVSKVNSYKEYCNDITVRKAVERDLAIIGEAIVKIKKLHPEIELTGIKKIIGFRNLIIHSYDSVKNDFVWLVVKIHLPVLKTEVEKLLEE